MVSFLYRDGRWIGYARVTDARTTRACVQVRPDGWTHGIWIGREEVIG
jgi:hypothetical protein